MGTRIPASLEIISIDKRVHEALRRSAQGMELISIGGMQFAVVETQYGTRYGGHSVFSIAHEVATPVTNLPKIGEQVVVHDPDGDLMYGHGESGEVIAHVENTAVVRMSYGLGCFVAKNLLTRAQVEQSERREVLAEMQRAVDCGSHGPQITLQNTLMNLYDAGYRKQEAE